MSGPKNSLRGDNSSQVCVLMRNSMAHKLLLGNGVSRGDTQKVVRHGTIAKVLPYQIDVGDNGNVDVPLQIVKDSPLDLPDDNIWLVNKNDTLPVPPALLHPLSAVSQMQRVKIAKNVPLCKQLADIRIGSKVYVTINDNSETLDVELAVVQYIGPISKGETAHHYGLVLSQGSKQGNSNGRLHGIQYFTCDPNRGIFVGIDRLHPCPEEPLSRNSTIPSPTSYLQIPQECKESSKPKTSSAKLVLRVKERDKMPRYQPLKAEKTEMLIDVEEERNHPLKVGDRVVWMSDETGPEIGTVRWIGTLNGHREVNPFVGVEFDNPVGCGTGIHNKEALFETKKNHASFIPVDGLMKAEDFYGISEEYEQRRGPISSKTNEKSKHSSLRSDNPSKESSKLISDPTLWNSAVVKLPEYTDNTLKHSTSKPPKRSESNTCRTEYVFKEPLLNVNLTKERNENITKQKDIKSNAQKILTNLDISPILEINPKELHLFNSAKKVSKSVEGKSKHFSSQDMQCNSIDLGELAGGWVSVPKQQNQEKIRNSGASGLQAGQPNDNDLGLEVFGLGLQNFALNDADQQELPSSPIRSVSSDGSTNYYDTPDPNLDTAGGPIDLGVGSVVEVSVKDEPHYGVIRWMGTVPEDKKGRRVAGIEMEEEMTGCSDGAFQGRRYFQCNPKKALFTSLNMCRKDGRFQDLHHGVADSKARAYGVDEDVIPGAVKPPTVVKQEDMDNVCGKYKGIQGHHNSCYLDATLFSMFAFTSCFDSLLYRPQTKNDVPHYEEVQRVLREEIVNPLRKNQFCKWDRVMKLRTLLENHSSVTGLTSEEKDPEEFLTSLVAQILRAKPFLKLSSGQEAYHYQLFVDKDEHLQIPTVQQLFEQSFLASDIKLKEVPSCLIIQMPRFGKSYKMYPRIFPTQLLDVTDIIEDSPRQCTVCGKQAEFECKECFGKGGMGGTLESISFCGKCLDTVHSHKHRSGHRYRRLTVPDEFQILKEHCQIPRLYMQLFAVVCIETSHYVSFVKCGSADAPWCFFDSMADRKGEQNGYNIPEVVSCPDLPYWLTEDGALSLSAVKDDRQLPEHAKRLLCDAYMCMYQSTDMMMYR